MARFLLVPVVLLLGCAASPTPASPGAAPTSPAVVAATIGGGVSILAENGLITTVAKGNVAATDGAETIDLGEATLLRGFI